MAPGLGEQDQHCHGWDGLVCRARAMFFFTRLVGAGTGKYLIL